MHSNPHPLIVKQGLTVVSGYTLGHTKLIFRFSFKFCEKGGGWEIFIFYFSDCFEEQINAGRHIEYLEMKLSNRIK